MNKPIIGIVSKHYLKESVRPDMFIRDELKQAVFDNGGIAIGILLPKDEKKDVGNEWSNNFTEAEYNNLIEQIKLCNGIIFQGGGACDNYEMIIAKYCYDNDIPTLGICCGQNVIARALGGTTKEISNLEKHFDLDNKYVHNISINKDTKFYSIIKKDTMMVNSRHKRILDTYPKLVVSAVCEDGYPDVVEATDKKFYMGVRFHPESLYEIDENHNKIFKEFIKVCKSI